MMKHLTIIALSLLSLGVAAQEENQFTVDAQLRTRAEYNNGATPAPRNEGVLPATFINERARMGLGWKRDNLEMKVSMQHTGIWGQDAIADRNGRVAMNEAWAKLRFLDSFFVQVGRQQLSYDDERILGGLDWNVAGNWHDALRFGFEEGADKFHVALALNRSANTPRGDLYGGAMPYKDLELLWYHHDFQSLPLGISAMAMNVGRESATAGNSDVKALQTFGVDVNFKPAKWDMHAALYYQMGKNVNDREVSSLMASAKVGYQFNPKWTVSLGYDFLNGEDYMAATSTTTGASFVYTSNAKKTHAFQPLYGTHHKFYGAMDYFYASAFASNSYMQWAPGLQDLQLGIDFKPTKMAALSLNYHYFLTASDVLIEDSKALGHEIDLQATLKLQKDVTLMGGYSTFLGTKTMDLVKGGDHERWQDWAFIQLNINPRIFSAKW